VQLSVAHVVAHVVARSVARGHAKQVPRDHCTGCRAPVSSSDAIARHNQECAETGERSYQGHSSYQTPAQRFGAIKAEQDANVKARLARNGVVDWR